jgi:4'-phosphopantetheinyl transferase
VQSLPEAEAHVWLARPDAMYQPGRRERHLAVLSARERERLQRLRRDRARREFLAAHALARITLSRYAPVAPAAWTFFSGEHGKPEVGGSAAGERLRFNLSHSGGLVVCAVIRELDIGVDVECTTRRRRHEEIAERFFGAAEVEALRALPAQERKARFLEIWTLKEAYLKAGGSGITIPLRSFQFHLSESAPPRISFDPARLRDDPAAWQFSLHRPTPIHTLALAIRDPDGGGIGVRLFDGFPDPG